MHNPMRVAGRFSLLFGLAIALAAVPGCGGGNGGTDSIPVNGKVTDPSGAPLSGVSISFDGVGSKAFKATGVSGEDGSYQLSTSGENDGAPEGEYTIALSGPDGKTLKADPAKATVAEGKTNQIDIKASK